MHGAGDGSVWARFWSNRHLQPTLPGTFALLLAALLAFAWGPQETPADTAQAAAIIMALGLGISVLCDWRVSLRNLVRIDLMAIAVLYFLTFFEFLFPQEDFSTSVTVDETVRGIQLVLLGMVALTLGRHLIPPKRPGFQFVQQLQLPPWMLFGGLVAAFFFANLWQFMAVQFNPVEWFEQIQGARFSQPWSRGRLGGWSSLLSELALLGYIVPPAAGLIYAKRRHFKAWQLLLVTAILGLQIFAAVCAGTRNVFGAYLVGLAAGYFLVQPRLQVWKLALAGAVVGFVFVVVGDHMLKFRQVGFATYVEYHDPPLFSFLADEDELINDPFMEGKGYFVDYNLLSIIQLMRAFPERYPYLGFEMPWVAATKPIPRAIWPGKPEGLSVGIEEAIGVEGLTVSCTFVGETYMAAGVFGVLLGGLFFGAVAAFYNRLGGQGSSLYSLLMFAVCTYAMVISMRSITSFTTALLPVFALWVFARVFLRNRRAQPAFTPPAQLPYPLEPQQAQHAGSAYEPRAGVTP